MAVARIHKTKDYTVMSNHHFREKKMSLKAKGLLSLMLSLPDAWDYSIAGLVTLSKDGKDSVMNALNELETFGYLIRTKTINEKRQFAGYDYDIFENPDAVKPYAENPNTDNPNAEKPQQLNTNQLNTNQSITNESNTNKKKTAKAVSQTVIEAYTDDTTIKELLFDWVEVRKAKRAPITEKALQLNIKKLDKLAKESNMPVNTYLEEVISRGWAAFYAIKPYGNSGKVYGRAGVEIKPVPDEDDILKGIL